MTFLQVTIRVDEQALSPARLVGDLTHGFQAYRENVYGLAEEQLQLHIETLTVRQARRKRGIEK